MDVTTVEITLDQRLENATIQRWDKKFGQLCGCVSPLGQNLMDAMEEPEEFLIHLQMIINRAYGGQEEILVSCTKALVTVLGK